MKHPDTIVAPATARGRAGVAVIRVSGPGAHAALALAGLENARPRHAHRATIRNSAGAILDDGIALWFPAPHSFTGEDVCEWQIHGGSAVVEAALAAIIDTGARLARPGEFTRRAFENDKLDLAQVEGLADLIDAETDAQRRAALRQMDGTLGRACADWSQRLKRALAHLEASIDFADEELPDDLGLRIGNEARGIAAEIAAALRGADRAERLREGYRVAILGAPNAGKSTLLNALARRDAALTSPEAGTTRDAIEVALDLHGYPVTLIDTAGLRASAGAVEAAGIEKARRVAAEADLRLFVTALDAPLPGDIRLAPHDLVFSNKADLGGETEGLSGSAREGQGLDALIEAITKALALGTADPGAALVARRRQREALGEARDALTRLAQLADDGARLIAYPELAAEEARVAMAAMGRVTGRVGVEDLLDVIFSDFCLGK